MNKLVIHGALILFFSINSFCQIDRAAILEKKIKSIKQITYQNEDSAQKDIYQTIYGVRGNDSLRFDDGVLSFKYVGKFDDKGRVSQLIRYDEKKEREDEWHTYKYNPDGSYSIEIITQGAGTVYSKKYDKRNLLIEEVTEFGTAVYQRNASGKTEKIFFTEKYKKTEVITIYHDDKKGLLVNEDKTKEGKAIYFRYNDKGLVSEMKMVSEGEKGKKHIETNLFEYEFYE